MMMIACRFSGQSFASASRTKRDDAPDDEEAPVLCSVSRPGLLTKRRTRTTTMKTGVQETTNSLPLMTASNYTWWTRCWEELLVMVICLNGSSVQHLFDPALEYEVFFGFNRFFEYVFYLFVTSVESVRMQHHHHHHLLLRQYLW